jgi:hypothetical protein
MSAFDYILLLLSFVFALALTHLLSRVGELLLARRRVRFSGLQTLVIINAIVQVYLAWLTIWDTRSVRVWDLSTITIFFAFAIGNYFVCVAASPEIPAEGPIDMEASYWNNRRLFYGIVAMLSVVSIATNFAFLETPNPPLFLQSNLLTLPFFVPSVLAFTVSARWAQWASGLSLLTLSIGWCVIFVGVLR